MTASPPLALIGPAMVPVSAREAQARGAAATSAADCKAGQKKPHPGLPVPGTLDWAVNDA